MSYGTSEVGPLERGQLPDRKVSGHATDLQRKFPERSILFSVRNSYTLGKASTFLNIPYLVYLRFCARFDGKEARL